MTDWPGAAGVPDLTKAVTTDADAGGCSQPAGNALPAELQAVVGFANGFAVDELEDIRIKISTLDHVVLMHRPPRVEYLYEVDARRVGRFDLGNAIDRIAAAQCQIGSRHHWHQTS